MKRCVIILLGLIFCFCARAETKNITLTFNESDFVFNNNNDTLSFDSYVHTLIFDNDTTTPAIPQVPVNIIINNNKSFCDITYSYTDTLIRENAYILPNQKDTPTSAVSAFSSTMYDYEESIYPYSNVVYSRTNIVDGNKILSFMVSPFRYDAVNKKLFLLTTIDVCISLESVSSQIAHTAQRMKQSVANMVYNKNEVVETMINNYDYEYIIVTCDSLKNSFQKLADWKTIKGIKSKVITVEEIDSLYTGISQQIRIKKALKNYYNGNYSGLKYVLLGGDVEIVPTQMCFIKNYRDIDTTATDIFYVGFDNMIWDDNNNGVYGEIEDNVDLAPDAVISRIPAKNNADANIMIKRIIDYESNPNIDNWSDSMLFSGSLMCEYYNNSNYSDANALGVFMHMGYVKPYWDSEKFYYFDTQTDFYENDSYDLLKDSLQQVLSKGYTFVNMDTHGLKVSWKMEQDAPPFTNQEAQCLENKRYTNIITGACYTNAFDTITSLSEAFINNPQGGILSYIGSSRYAWYQTSMIFDRNLMKNFLQNPQKGLCTALHETKLLFLPKYDEYNSYRWLFFSINMLGDPEMTVYLSCPQKFDNVFVDYSNEITSINTGVDSCRVCISSIIDNNFYMVEDNIQELQLENLNDSYFVCITKQGYIPYVAIVGDVVHIQNKVLNANIDIYSTQTLIGNNITHMQEQGDVVIEKGKTTITHANGVHITQGFTVKEGAEFLIQSKTN